MKVVIISGAAYLFDDMVKLAHFIDYWKIEAGIVGQVFNIVEDRRIHQ